MLFASLILGLGSALSYAAAVPVADPAALPDSPAISSVTHSGNGCPQGSKFEVAGAGKQFKLFEFATRGPAAETRTQNCALHFDVGGNAGWQVSLKHVSVRGHGYFPQGEGLTYYLTNFWSDAAADTGTVQGSWTNNNAKINGPLVIEIDIPSSARVWSRCGSGGILNPNFRTAIQDTGYFGTRGDTVTTETLTYEWRAC